MELEEFVAQLPQFASSSHPDKIRIFGWFLHTYGNLERFDAPALRRCYERVHLTEPVNIHATLKQLSEQKPPILLRDPRGYRLEARVRAALDERYGQSRRMVAVSKILADLPAKVPQLAERAFLGETIICFRNSAFRACIVMAWNLAYYHLLEWIFNDAARLATFNAQIPVRYKKKTDITITKLTDFEDLKESEVIEVCNSANLFSKNITRILNEKLVRRNLAAHPSDVIITEAQAEDVITDLVNNVVLHLT
jgi:hypothetical protein